MESSEKSRLLRIRKFKKRHNPKFVRVESWRYVRLAPSWRRPKGLDNKTRRKTRAGVKMPNVGYEVPAAIRGLHPSGLIDTLIYTIKDLDSLDPAIHGIRISGKVGAKKRIKIVETAFEKKFKILNTTIEVEKEEETTPPAAEQESKDGKVEAKEEIKEEEKSEEISLKKKHIKEIKEKIKQKENSEEKTKAGETKEESEP